MSLHIPQDLLERIHLHGEQAYPEEGAGLLLGEFQGQDPLVREILSLVNVRERQARHNRYHLSPQDYLQGEELAEQLGLVVLGVFHSHPDHPNRPSEFDRQWAWPNFSYLITSVVQGQAAESRSWRLNEDRAAFSEEQIVAVVRVQP
ncbi:MAG: M67 family metallopeptidase [Anaerolineales bacterium]|nr:M67 family metallopeptidase [Anaerolineales bacterium]